MHAYEPTAPAYGDSYEDLIQTRGKPRRPGRTAAAGAAFLCAAGAALGMSQPVVAQQVGEALWDITAAWMPDGNLTPGTTDKGGDRKQAQFVLRDNTGMVYGFNSGLLTPQGRVNADNSVTLRDTGFAEIFIGRENITDARFVRYSLYGHAGVINGFMTDAWQDAVRFAHGGRARTSQASSGLMPLVGASGRADYAFNLLDIGDRGAVDINVAGFATATTLNVSGGAGLFASINLDAGGHFRPNLPDMPLVSNTGYSLYGGVTAQAFAYDRATDALGTNPVRLQAVAGASARFNRTNIFIEYIQPLNNDVRRGWNTPVKRLKVGVTQRF